ncbi:hypothetical protein JRQ81_003161 [Phrynocephalus forsythii]|uniref:Uncharacterized protein n=1 Tax=Phrynocephalus forsythii TaxID=171643 RepID=A0A9Q0XJ87_9SAUR|nr:hypothetical protein JRQ81_003161 [Phrynocephalus forsythii]
MDNGCQTLHRKAWHSLILPSNWCSQHQWQQPKWSTAAILNEGPDAFEGGHRDNLFQQLCEENNKDFQMLVLHTQIRWLSKGNHLQCFAALWDAIVFLMYDKELGEKRFHTKEDIFHLADIFQKHYLLNKILQGKNSGLVR